MTIIHINYNPLKLKYYFDAYGIICICDKLEHLKYQLKKYNITNFKFKIK